VAALSQQAALGIPDQRYGESDPVRKHQQSFYEHRACTLRYALAGIRLRAFRKTQWIGQAFKTAPIFQTTASRWPWANPINLARLSHATRILVGLEP